MIDKQYRWYTENSFNPVSVDDNIKLILLKQT